MKKSLLLVLFICIYLTFPALSRDLENKYDKDNIFIEKDPLISFNKPVYVFNDKLYRYIARPVTKIWASVFPSYFMTRIDKFADNMAFPVRFVSCFAQGKFKDSGVETTRFLTNTTLGIAGFYDPANYYFDLRKKDESIAQVLQRWGLASGPYLVLPFYGSSDIRGLGGTLFDKALNPLTYVPGSGAIIGINKATGYIDKALKMDMIYYNPYEASKYYYAIRNYTKFEDYDRQHVFIQKDRQFNSKNQSEFNKPINNKTFANANEANELVESVKYYFNPIIRPKKTFWSKQAIWNKDFSKQFKFKELKIDKNKSVYNYRFIKQKNHNSPLVIIIPGFAEGVDSQRCVEFAQILYEQGYSVLLVSSLYSWNYMEVFKADERIETYLNTINKIVKELELQNKNKFNNKTILALSVGASHSISMSEIEKTSTNLNIDKYILLSPILDVNYALNKWERYSDLYENLEKEDKKTFLALLAVKSRLVARNPNSRISFSEKESKLFLGKMYSSYKRLKKHIISESGFIDIKHKETLEPSDYLNIINQNSNFSVITSSNDYLTPNLQEKNLSLIIKTNIKILNSGSHLGYISDKKFINLFIEEVNLK